LNLRCRSASRNSRIASAFFPGFTGAVPQGSNVLREVLDLRTG
jgi:hypothetical protein